ncbi:MAG TPA: DUF2993 domain-containing protein [Jatrophihabitans sp.]|jgi:hypothetical protein
MVSGYDSGYAYAPPAPARRRRRWPIVLLIVLLVLVGLAVAADRVALGLAEDKAASALQTSQGLSHKPDVSVEGFPFLTQLASGDFGEIVVTADDLSVGTAHDVHIDRVRVDLHDVTVSNNYSTFHANTATADGSMGYPELSRLLHTTVHAGSGGRLITKPSVHLLGQTFTGTVSAIVHASSARGITFTDPKVTVDGVHVPAVVAQALAAVFERSVSLAGLPFHVRVTGARVGPDALVLELAGRDLTYQR